MTPTPSPARRRRTARLVAALLPAALLVAGCDVRDAYETTVGVGFPDPITEQGERIHDLWIGSAAAALVVGIFVWSLMLFAGLRYRKKSDQLPRQVRYNLPIEVLYTVVPFVIIAVLFYYTTVAQNFVNDLTDEDEGGADMTIGVVGFQWNWTFNYVDEGVGVTGTPQQQAVLYLPTDTRIRFVETSPDVIHSFYVPQFLFKRDVIPGRENTFEVTLNKEGEYVGRCAELCGEKHSAMNFSVRVVSPQAYEDYIGGLAADPRNAIATVGTGAITTEASEAGSE